MPQTFVALQCAFCNTFQGQLDKKSKKFTCVICHAQQSFRTVFAVSNSGKDIRLTVQQLNELRGAQEEVEGSLDVLPFGKDVGQPTDTSDSGVKHTDWTEFAAADDDHDHSTTAADEAGFVTAVPDVKAGRKSARTALSADDNREQGFSKRPRILDSMMGSGGRPIRAHSGMHQPQALQQPGVQPVLRQKQLQPTSQHQPGPMTWGSASQPYHKQQLQQQTQQAGRPAWCSQRQGQPRQQPINSLPSQGQQLQPVHPTGVLAAGLQHQQHQPGVASSNTTAGVVLSSVQDIQKSVVVNHRQGAAPQQRQQQQWQQREPFQSRQVGFGGLQAPCAGASAGTGAGAGAGPGAGLPGFQASAASAAAAARRSQLLTGKQQRHQQQQAEGPFMQPKRPGQLHQPPPTATPQAVLHQQQQGRRAGAGGCLGSAVPPLQTSATAATPCGAWSAFVESDNAVESCSGDDDGAVCFVTDGDVAAQWA